MTAFCFRVSTINAPVYFAECRERISIESLPCELYSPLELSVIPKENPGGNPQLNVILAPGIPLSTEQVILRVYLYKKDLSTLYILSPFSASEVQISKINLQRTLDVHELK